MGAATLQAASHAAHDRSDRADAADHHGPGADFRHAANDRGRWRWNPAAAAAARATADENRRRTRKRSGAEQRTAAATGDQIEAGELEIVRQRIIEYRQCVAAEVQQRLMAVRLEEIDVWLRLRGLRRLRMPAARKQRIEDTGAKARLDRRADRGRKAAHGRPGEQPALGAGEKRDEEADQNHRDDHGVLLTTLFTNPLS